MGQWFSSVTTQARNDVADVQAEARKLEAFTDGADEGPQAEEAFVDNKDDDDDDDAQERNAKERMSQLFRKATAAVGESGIGKTFTLTYLISSNLVSPDTYANLNSGKPVDDDQLEACAWNRRLGLRGGVAKSPRILHIPLQYMEDSEKMEEEIREMEEFLDWVPSYKLNTSWKFRNPQVFCPLVESGDAGSPCQVVFSHSNEVHSLFRFYNLKTLHNWIKSGLDIMAERTMEGELDQEYFQTMLRLLLPAGTDLNMELEKYTADSAAYMPPLTAWVEKVAGRSIVFRTLRIGPQAGQATPADLLRALVAQYEVNTLFMAPDRLKPDTRSALLQAFAAEDPEGPWELLAADLQDGKENGEDILECLPAILELVCVFAPGVPGTFVDTLGVSDRHTVRRKRQREMETHLRNVLVMLPKNLRACTALYTHLRQSPFMAAWVKERATQPDSSTWERNLTIMLTLEKEGCNPERKHKTLGSEVGVPYLLKQQEHLKGTMEGPCTKTKQYLVPLMRHLLMEVVKMSGKDADRLAPQLAQSIKVFYSFPSLGMALTQSPEQLGRRGAPREALAPEVLQQLREATRVDEFVAELMMPQVRAAAQQMVALDAELAKTQVEVSNLAERFGYFGAMDKLRGPFKDLVLDKVKRLDKKQLRDTWMGPTSVFRETFNNLMLGFRDEIYQRAPGVLGVKTKLAEAAVARVMESLETVLAVEPARTLLTVLHPSYSWQHHTLPLSSYLEEAVMEVWSSRMEELHQWLMGPYQDKLVARSISKLMTPTCMALLGTVDQVKEEHQLDPKKWPDIVALVFDRYGLKEEIRKAFKRAFVPPRGSPIRLYKLLLEEVLEELQDSLPTAELHANLLSAKQRCRSPTEWAQTVQSLLRVTLHKQLVKLGDAYEQCILTLLEEQYLELRMRLYEKMMPHVKKSVSRTQSVFIPAFFQFTRVLLGIVGSHNGTVNQQLRDLSDLILAKRLSLAEQLNPEAWLGAVLKQLPKSGDAQQDASRQQLLQAALRCAFTRLAQQQQRHSQLWSLAPLPPPAVQPAAATQPAATAVQPAASAQSNWDRSGVSVTAEEMARFKEHVEGAGFVLLDCPSAGNNCMLYAVLHQMIGVRLDAYDAERVEGYRARMAALLREELDSEAALLDADGGGPQALGDESWHLRLARLAGVEEETAAAVKRAANEHLRGLEAGAQLNLLDLSLLRGMLGWDNMRVVVFNPTFDAARDYSNVMWEPADPERARDVLIANVWAGWWSGVSSPGARGELNHFMVVQRRVQQLGAGPGSASTGAAQNLSPGAAYGRHKRHAAEEPSEPNKQPRR
ncbi:hypothetical protein GPECTOR_21g751 [Gonium pectorale]|uniref:Uncharacterized protein n=1 Tax=Gonium pectorale TaxID=33097 RepID=A0A150GIL2_GONPE|nr:hypothetical protein GPECTOR_21g751 [Gonium pectorale]|eukprot:KXZ49525.1 hypothetical protein GPECTOR_21g751 [Gonium pectorale]